MKSVSPYISSGTKTTNIPFAKYETDATYKQALNEQIDDFLVRATGSHKRFGELAESLEFLANDLEPGPGHSGVERHSARHGPPHDFLLLTGKDKVERIQKEGALLQKGSFALVGTKRAEAGFNSSHGFVENDTLDTAAHIVVIDAVTNHVFETIEPGRHDSRRGILCSVKVR